jgi:copper resistance protein B
MRYDSAADLSSRSWLAAGVQGLAPYWFEIDATVYVGNDSRTALALKAEYELLITQKLVLQPAIEANLYGKDDPAVDIGKGLSDMRVGVRLRYEIKREFAPYVGLEYVSKYGNTADIARAAGSPVSDTRLVAGLRFWY